MEKNEERQEGEIPVVGGWKGKKTSENRGWK